MKKLWKKDFEEKLNAFIQRKEVDECHFAIYYIYINIWFLLLKHIIKSIKPIFTISS